MYNTPPPLPENRPPPLPDGSRPKRRAQSASPSLLAFSPVKAWFSLAMIAGLAGGRVKDEWRDLFGGVMDDIALAVVVLLFAGLGLAGFACSLWYLKRRPELGLLFGVKRSYWQAGIPLAWLFGFGVGIMWRYL